MKNFKIIFPFLLGILLLFLLGSWMITKNIAGLGAGWGATPCACGVAGAAGTGLWSVADGGAAIAKAPFFNFVKQKAVPTIPAKTDAALGDVATYLKKNKDRQLTLTGLYDDEEKHRTGKLGLERAGSIKDVLIKKGVPAGQILTKSAERKDLKFPENKLRGGVAFAFAGMAAAPIVKDTFNPRLIISDKTGDKLDINVPQNIGFKKNNYEVMTPLDGKVETSFKQVASHLNKHPQKTISLTGLYEKNEKNTSLLSNLGEARANSVKNQLTRLGAKSSQIETYGRLVEKLPMKDSQIIGGMDYLFENNKAVDNNRLPAIEKALRANPITLYFETNSDRVILTKEQRKLFSDLIYYMDRKGGAKVGVTGHTDNVGSAAGNLSLSGRRADFIKNYLSKNGVNLKQILSSGKGLTAPIATNDTKEGRAKNRRVEVRLK